MLTQQIGKSRSQLIPEVSLTDCFETSHTLRLVLTFLTLDDPTPLRQSRRTGHFDDLIGAYRFGVKYDSPLALQGISTYILDWSEKRIFNSIDLFMIGSILEQEAWLRTALVADPRKGTSMQTPVWGEIQGDRTIRLKNFTVEMFERVPARYLHALAIADSSARCTMIRDFENLLSAK